ncbi:MAG: hypothetical protein L0H96_01425 [Humibacillus sp.]|nr:hypothetical protein [Humibacillus sp.]MDN5775555.1 hypothetical protein [Humibacillus sp.]
MSDSVDLVAAACDAERVCPGLGAKVRVSAFEAADIGADGGGIAVLARTNERCTAPPAGSGPRTSVPRRA